jgi:hypothetical protein
MLDVHPPHESVHTWRDFFIHIATIVIGLIIAVGLEQTVELLHHRHQLHQAREQIRTELTTNLEWNRTIDDPGVARIFANMDRNIALLRAAEEGHPAPNATFDFSWQIQGFNDAAYRIARENGAVALMSYAEAETYSDMYDQQQITFTAFVELIAQLKTAQSITLRGHTLAQMSPAEIQELLAACSAAKGKAVAVSEWTADFNDEAHITLHRMDAYR